MWPAFLFRADERFQLRNVLSVDPAAQCEDHFPVRLPVNSQQCRSSARCEISKSSAKRKPLKIEIIDE